MLNMTRIFIVWGLVGVLSACVCLPKPQPMNFPMPASSASYQAVPGRTEEPRVLFMGDPQIHNIYGVGLKQMIKTSDMFSKVAIRPPEVNLLAPYSLDALLERGLEKKPAVVVVLGDGTNIGCSSEYDVFSAKMKAHTEKAGVVWLMAHGNHDSYMMGTLNNYGPIGKSPWVPKEMPDSKEPTDESWWGNVEIENIGKDEGWNIACYTAEETSGEPMNKVRWLARYTKQLRSNGLQVKSEAMGDKDGLKRYRLEGFAKDGKLARLNYRMKGEWWRPDFSGLPIDSGMMKSWNSFIVQSVDISPSHRLILIDTSVCPSAADGRAFASSNAGKHGCIGDEQMDVIRELAVASAGMKITFAGHFPLADLTGEERGKLMQVMESGQPWDYISAHTHHAVSQIHWNGGRETNIGSTTDWPAEAQILDFSIDSGRPDRQMSLYAVESGFVQYKPAKHEQQTELCRHLPAAQQLAELVGKDLQGTWKSPAALKGCAPKKKDEWYALRKKMDGYLKTIQDHMSDPVYRQKVMKVFAGASFQESQTRDLSPLIP